jgi:hydrogenase expression/formation protein HypD
MSPSRARTERALARLRAASDKADRPLKFMEVCGTHTMAAFRLGLPSLLPENIELLSGPGCPVCVTAQGDIDMLIALAMDHQATVCTYGDMLRVPGKRGSLAKARARGADLRVVYSSLDAVKLAASEPERQVVFAAVGFETTAPASAAAVEHARRMGLDNFSVLTSHKLVMPALDALVASPTLALDGFLLPGHVSVILGSEIYRPLVEGEGLPCVIGGFEEALMLVALAELAEQAIDGRAELVNLYPEAVRPMGNRTAQALLERVFEPADVPWRGLGTIPQSGLVLREEYAAFDAQRRFQLRRAEDREPAGCICGEVITAAATPHDCRLFGTVCTPIQPIGPCMVSSEGTCQAWFKYRGMPETATVATHEIGVPA